MSIGGLMRTSVSGMNAQANRLGAVSDNIANSNTTGYKKATTEFSSLVLDSSPGQYNSGVVESQTRNLISQQGGLGYTSNANNSQAVDLAINGKGFLIVGDGQGGTFLTRAGAFVKNGNGDLVNAAGFVLQGYPLPMDDTNSVANGFAGLQNVNLNASELRLKATDQGTFRVNLDKSAAVVVAANLPGLNGATATPTSKESIVVFDNTGKQVILDIYMTKTAEGTPAVPAANGNAAVPGTNDTWEYAVFDRSKAGTGTTAPFPYTGGAITTATVGFDGSGKLVDPASGSFDLQIPGGQLMKLSLAGTSQLSSAYQALAASVNGNPPGNVDQIKISSDGVVSATFASGEDVPLFKIPLALVESPDNLKVQSGNVYSAGVESGTVLVSFGGQSGLGDLVHGALEESTVDLASELTTMIESQRGYTANSKVFQTGSEILDVLVNLKR